MIQTGKIKHKLLQFPTQFHSLCQTPIWGQALISASLVFCKTLVILEASYLHFTPHSKPWTVRAFTLQGCTEVAQRPRNPTARPTPALPALGRWGPAPSGQQGPRSGSASTKLWARSQSRRGSGCRKSARTGTWLPQQGTSLGRPCWGQTHARRYWKPTFLSWINKITSENLPSLMWMSTVCCRL